MKQCTLCGENKEKHLFPFRNKSTGKLFMWCKDCVKRKNAAYYEQNSDRIKSTVNAYRWDKKNPGKKNANTAKRRALKAQATPPWADLKTIQSYYEMARLLEHMTFGQKYHVDHVVPLKHRLVCGLHTVANITICRAEENLSKSNKFEPYEVIHEQSTDQSTIQSST